VLILIGPGFQATEASFQHLAQLTGLVTYDLKTKIRPGSWGVVRVLADASKARHLAEELKSQGFPAVLVDSEVAHDQNRRIVPVDKLRLEPTEMVLELMGRSMPVPYKGLLTIVRGEVHVRSEWRSAGPSSSNSYRAVVPTAEDIQAFRESQSTVSYDGFHVADLHFATVFWSARLDARRTDLSHFGELTGSQAQKLDQVVDRMAQLTQARVDRSVRTSSVASFATRPPPMRSSSPIPGSPVSAQDRLAPSDPHFDGYSRLVAQAERELLTQTPIGSPPSNSLPS
jgi:hypothetical protein